MKRLQMLMMAALMVATVGAKENFQLKDIVDGLYTEDGVSGFNSMKDGIHYTRLEDGGSKIVMYTYATGEKVKEIFNSEWHTYVGPKHIVAYEFSDDEQKILLISNKQKIYRRSYTADYHIFDTRYKTAQKLSDQPKQMVAEFSPNGKSVAFVSNNNLFIKSLSFDTEYQVTDDGLYNNVLNGIPDWVYEEEFEFNKAWEWSPDSRFIAFIRFDESKVKEYQFPLYAGMSPVKKEYELYPGQYSFKYPKAGEVNSTVEVKVYDSQSKVTRTMDVASADEEFYIPRIIWTQTAEKLCVLKQNRHQSKLQFLMVNPKSGISNPVIIEENERYIPEDYYHNIHFLADNEHLVYLSQQDGYNHIYLYTLGGKLVKQITKGKWDVTEFFGYDAKNKRYIFQAAMNSPLDRGIYAIDRKDRITALSNTEGWNTARFSSNFQYFLKEWSDVNTPKEVSVCNGKGNQVRILEQNTSLKKIIAEANYKAKEFFQFTTTNGDTLNGWMVKPSAMEAGKAYPLLMVQYSGPNSQQVTNKYGLGWEQFLADNGYIVACVDGRGTGARGEEFLKCTYLRLGQLEVEDQIEAAKYLGSQDYIDASRIGIWGWSYGGYMSALALSVGHGIFKAGISVAPVTHYKFYDTIYTERYMRKPGENPSGYKFCPLNLADQLQGRLLLVHGSADDNVHYQNTVEYAEALVQANKQFDMQVYTNRNHSIYGGNTRLHLYTKKFEWLETYLK